MDTAWVLSMVCRSRCAFEFAPRKRLHTKVYQSMVCHGMSMERAANIHVEIVYKLIGRNMHVCFFRTYILIGLD